MRRIFGSRPTRFEKGDAIRLKTALPSANLDAGTVGTISRSHRTKLPSYDVQFINVGGVVGRFVVDEPDLMPADGRRFDDNDVVRLRRDVPSQNLKSGTVGVVSEVSYGPPIRYVVEFVDANGRTIAQTALFDEDLASPDAPQERSAEAQDEQGAGAGPEEETGLADDQLDELIAELRTQGQAMQQQAAQERAEQAPNPQEVPAAQEQALQEQAEEPAAGGTRNEPPSDGRRTRFVRGEPVKLDSDLPSSGLAAGSEGTVTWVILGPPVSYLVEFRAAGGGSSPPTKVEETYLSFAG